MANWMPIPNINYEANELGQLRSKGFLVNVRYGKTAFRKGKILKPVPHNSGYRVVSIITAPGIHYTELVHLLVLRAHAGEAPQGQECRHLDGDKSNNAISNLRWGTRAENVADIVRLGRHAFGKRNGKYTKPWATPVMVRRANGTFLGGA